MSARRIFVVAYAVLLGSAVALTVSERRAPEPTRSYTGLVTAADAHQVSVAILVQGTSQVKWIDNGERFVTPVPPSQESTLLERLQADGAQVQQTSSLSFAAVLWFILVGIIVLGVPLGLAVDAIAFAPKLAGRLAWLVVLFVPVVGPLLYIWNRRGGRPVFSGALGSAVVVVLGTIATLANSVRGSIELFMPAR